MVMLTALPFAPWKVTMRVPRRIITLGAATLVAAGLTVGSATMASASIVAKITGSGPTLAAAEQQARTFIEDSYSGCAVPYALIGDGQYANGNWWATLETTCKAVY